MKRRIFLVVLALVVGILSYQIRSFEFLLILFIVLSLIFLSLAGTIKIFRKVRPGFINIPIWVTGICLAGVLISLFRPLDAAIKETGTPGEQLAYAYKTDQQDRKQLKSLIGFISDLKQRDELRLKQVKEIYAGENNLNSLDKFHAAFVYHHSDNSRDYETASSLAAAAAKDEELQDHYQVQWLRKAAYDRWRLSLGKPEKYNTQNKFSFDLE